ncbi:hypothetical protein BT96DRAFT_671106 [Gymnopus androsaceus JB14]|uniref:X-box-binding protein 1 n=1 Tax=Gymnopus androsaceus JB14 TaxID=1447944 RepID=A0A6A4IIC6_9AGAR|nr:hypothetical protein BT96DRAFT_671106 [Gymnopus androsaceus JB14]
MPKASTTKTSSFIDPASLSFPSPSDDMSSPSPEPGPSRKRPRTEQSSEERKEARAHRNRIAAQNSRDRRKAQFTFLERRVAELEEENRQLRAGMGMPLPVPASVPVLMPPVAKSSSDEARERENEELKERIRTLEKGWDAVVKALAAQGLPTGIAPSTNTDSTPSASPSVTVSAPVTVTPSSPAPSPSSPSLSASVTESSSQEAHQSTRHLARVATIGGTPPPLSLQRVNWPSTTPTVTLPHPPLISRPPLALKMRQLTTLPWNLSSARSSPSLSANLRLSHRRRVFRLVVSLSRKRPPPRRK